ncbi:MAG: methylated-DNA--[protein]-cysteine S-methyltransferase, partial [Candidatus Methanomethylophilaceae archaeon]
DGEGRITGIFLPNSNLPSMEDRETDAIAEAAAQLDEYLSGKRRKFDLELSYDGSGFRRTVMESMMEIPYGEVRSYRELAEMAGSPKAYRAVGTVCSGNPLPIVIPCHRVVPSSGGLGSYSGGTALKKRLLDHERSMA